MGESNAKNEVVERDIKKFTKGDASASVGDYSTPETIYLSFRSFSVYIEPHEAENLAEVLAHAIRRSREVSAIEKAANDL